MLTDKEKERLQNLMAYGQCIAPATSKQTQKEIHNGYEHKLPDDEIFDHCKYNTANLITYKLYYFLYIFSSYIPKYLDSLN